MHFDRVYIDFHSGTHGHFLEYLCNRYLADLSTANFNPFTKFGTSHVRPSDYLEDRKFKCGHFEDSGLIKDNDAVIRIVVDDFYYVAVYNFLVRTNDTPLLDLNNLETDALNNCVDNFGFGDFKKFLIDTHGEDLKNLPRAILRSYLYAKLNSPNMQDCSRFNKFSDLGVPVFEFPISVFYNYNKLVSRIGELSGFLGKIGWGYQESMFQLWQEFMAKNAGWASHCKCESILLAILSKSSQPLKCNILEEAWINIYLTKTFGIHDHIPSFSSNVYPTDTLQLYESIENQIKINRNIL